MKHKKLVVLTVWFIFGLAASGTAQVSPQTEPSGDSISQGLWWLYHLQYTHARELFDQYIHSHPADPAGYFYKTATDWWQLAQEYDYQLPDVVKLLEEDYQDTLRTSYQLLESSGDAKTKGLACLYAGGAEGLKGRWLVTQGQWIKAYFRGKNGHRMLKKALEYDPTLYDAYLGLGIYDYYTDTLPGVQRLLAALLIHGDRQRGLQELQWAIDKGDHARVEAQMFLIEIYTWEEQSPAKALPIAQDLHQEFPKRPAMYLAEIMDYYELNQWDHVTNEAKEYLMKSEEAEPYYRHEGVYPARYCLGVAALLGQRDPDTCLTYMNKIVDEADPSSRWVSFAYLRMGQVYDLKGEREKALSYYHKVLERPHFWGSHHLARQYIREPFKY